MLGCFCKQKEVRKMVNIAELRMRHGKMSQKELAKELGTEQANISRWENNPLSMNSKNLIKVALYFNVSIDDLLGVDKSA
ncbi:DNA-binding helix-turn-helix protein [Enterococcus faecalis TX4248]|jgi:transcriptional regulator with XRE-family HTH domain|uniref:DNA-binding helix-turn-helix protein n=3 Tax=Bacteria TaxID=2 RepID=A0A125W4T6_ENTFL|nr:DNA-binding helix-turn-helix protein [Enterococcus faecalis TX4248]